MKMNKKKAEDYNYFEDEQDEADAEDYVIAPEKNFINTFT